MIELTNDKEFAILTIRRPDALNAVSFDLIGRIGALISEAGRSDARALIVTGEGERPFCAGADIKELQDRGLQVQCEGAELGQAVFSLLDRAYGPLHCRHDARRSERHAGGSDIARCGANCRLLAY